MVPNSRCIVTTDLNFTIAKSEEQIQILFLGRQSLESRDLESIVRKWRQVGVSFISLKSELCLNRCFRPVQEAYAIYDYLKQKNFKTLHFADNIGLAYYCLLAKKQGLAFLNTEIKISYQLNRDFAKSEDEIIQDFFVAQSYQMSQQILSYGYGSDIGNPLISVCMVTCDRPHYLERALRSLQMQTYKNFEIIIADNSKNPFLSTENLSSFPNPVRIIHPKIKTPGQARNEAAAQCSGKYLLFMDDDNIAAPDELATFLLAAERSSADILTCAHQHFRDDIEIKSIPTLPYWVPIGPLLTLGIKHNVFGDTNFFIKREAFDKVGGFRAENFFGEDWEFLSRAVLKGCSLTVVPERLYFYREHPTNLTKELISLSQEHLRLAPYFEYLPKEVTQYIQVATAEKTLGKINPQLQDHPLFYTYRFISAHDLFSKINNSHNADILELAGVLSVSASGDDPWFEFELPSELNGPIEVDFWINLNEEQYVQVFWRENSFADFKEETSLTKVVPAGLRRVTLLISDPERFGSLRLDLEKENAKVLIHSIVVKGLVSAEKISSRRLNFKLKEFQMLSANLSPGFYCGGERLGLSELELVDVSVDHGTDSLRITSTSVDPQMIFKDFKKYKIRHALLSYQIKADQEFQFRIFWKTEKDSDFTESKVSSHSFGRGNHCGQIVINSEDTIERLRIDPLESLGSVQLQCLTIDRL